MDRTVWSSALLAAAVIAIACEPAPGVAAPGTQATATSTTGAGGMSGATSSDTGNATSSTAGSGGSGSGGTLVTFVAWPDSKTTFCNDGQGTMSTPCPKPQEPLYGQDGNYQLQVPVYTVSTDSMGGKSLHDSITQLDWQSDYGDATFETAPAYCKALSLAGKKDWRVPSLTELVSVMDFGLASVLDPTLFAEDTNSPYFWSATAHATDSIRAWLVRVDEGVPFDDKRSTGYHVRCVRGGAPAVGPRFSTTSDGIRDQLTGLTWQTQPPTDEVEWPVALTRCLQLSPPGSWRLPNVKELLSLLDAGKYPSLPAMFGKVADEVSYWSSTPSPQSGLFSVNANGGVSTRSLSGMYPVRCVRGP
jgi:hypothetical protein